MGTCWSCGTQILLEDKEVTCDKCGEILKYTCNTCHTPFLVLNKETSQKLIECKLCSYFICPECGACSYNCPQREWEKRITIIINSSKVSNEDKIKQIVNYIKDIKSANNQRKCARGIPISYAKGRIKGLLIRLDGFKIRDIEDLNAFREKVDTLMNEQIETSHTISRKREPGTYGQEYRDVFNYLVCKGCYKIERKTHPKSKKEYSLWTRIDGNPCKYLNEKDKIISKCPKCNKLFSEKVTQCDTCVGKKGKNKGVFKLTEKKISNVDSCQMYRGDFRGK